MITLKVLNLVNISYKSIIFDKEKLILNQFKFINRKVFFSFKIKVWFFIQSH